MWQTTVSQLGHLQLPFFNLVKLYMGLRNHFATAFGYPVLLRNVELPIPPRLTLHGYMR